MMSEDQRIRDKNKVHNEAYELYESLRAMNYSDGDITRHLQLCLSTSQDDFRNKIYLSALKIVEKTDEINIPDNNLRTKSNS